MARRKPSQFPFKAKFLCILEDTFHILGGFFFFLVWILKENIFKVMMKCDGQHVTLTATFSFRLPLLQAFETIVSDTLIKKIQYSYTIMLLLEKAIKIN